MIATPVARLAERTIDAMAERLGRETEAVPGELFLPFELYTSENI